MLAVALLTFATAVKAADLTYSFVDYPADETDAFVAYTDSIAGTIVTDGTLGAWTTNHILSGSITFVSSVGTQTLPIDVPGWAQNRSTPV